ncbi:MAG: hypothetical protein J6T10_22070 [Methanobrevibacter sp.]|nr:hypothetical protein [Methanobrevibacter sp.]
MLNDFLEMFLGAFHNFVSVDCPHREYFDCVLSVAVLTVVCLGTMAIALAIVVGSFKLIRGIMR